MKIVKANGDIVAYDSNYLRRSLKSAGTDKHLVEKVIELVERQIYDLISTAELYKIVFKELRRLKRSAAGKYNLKRAIMELGPTGFPFEKFVAALHRAEGFSTETGPIIKGYCVRHEVDVVAEKGNLHFMMECKFHNESGKVCDLKTALYVYARFLDIEKVWKQIPGHRDKIHRGWLVTNMRFTSDAIKYGTCAGLGLLSWDFPAGESLRERIDRSGLHPITCLTSLGKKEKQMLLQRMIVLCRDLCEQPLVLHEIGVRGTKGAAVMEEAAAICGHA